jgi:hypothetical protein
MKFSNKNLKLYVFFLLLFVFTVPCTSIAGTIDSYYYDLVTGQVHTLAPFATAISAEVTIDDGAGPLSPVNIVFKTDKTFSLSGNIGGTIYNFTGEYTVALHGFGNSVEVFVDNGILINDGVKYISSITFQFDPTTGALLSGGAATLHIASVPVPAAGWLLGTGLVGLVGLRRKYRN